MIVDEEQRFGVKQKELLRQLKLRVDVIAMSATPIPRTLQMSLAGVRDISVIETPPEGRRPVKTYVGEYDEELVKQALEREKARGGQAFFLHNRVETIDETAERLRGAVPGAALRGRPRPDGREARSRQRMLRFLRGEADVLVATSIIESGIDIPQANTLIVERADIFGLAQLYQIRGRVGRSRERAYAYLLYPSAAALTQEAAKRLSALSDYTELGAGFKIAMRDLEIRGAGNLLGDEQSGHVAALGFELYLADARRGGARPPTGWRPTTTPEPVRLDVNVDAYVPADYVPYEQAKVDVHRRIAGAREVADLALLREELEDRFGPVPEPLEQPHRAPAGADQARPGRRARRSPSAASCSRSRRSSSTPCGATSCASGSPAALLRVRQSPAVAARARRSASALSASWSRAADALLAVTRSRVRDPEQLHLTSGGVAMTRVLSASLTSLHRASDEDSNRTSVAGGLARWPQSLGVSACGSGGMPRQLGRHASVGQSDQARHFDHWMKIAAISQAGQTNPAAARPATVPDAPDFKACIADKKKTAAKPAKGQPEPTDAQLQDRSASSPTSSSQTRSWAS